MASKILLRSGAFMFNQLSNLFHHQTPHWNQQFLSRDLYIAPRLFSSLSKLPSSLQLPKNDVELQNKFSSGGFIHLCGLPSLRFFLPDDARQPRAAEESLLEE